MKRDFKSISDKTYDVIVIGGGIVGAGVARDTTLRGLDTLLIEKDDFGAGTTSRSTRLIHGGLRYLAQLDFGLVRQDLSEREVMLRIAPHLVHHLSFLIPVHSTFLNVEMALGVTLYDVLSFDKTLPNHKYFSKKKTLELEPGLKVKNLQGSYLYSDCEIPLTERLNFETALSAYENGATVVNHARATGLVREGDRITGVKIKDAISGDVAQAKGKMIVNAAGHWVDLVKEMIFPDKPAYLRRTKGVHIMIPKISNDALVLFSPVDGRLFFVIPWREYSLVGTTDTDYKENLDAVYATAADVKYILDGLHFAYPDVKTEDIYYAYAGLRSLALRPGKSASNTSRSHELIDHAETDKLEGLVTILGGKITAYRAVARDATDLVCKKMGNKAKCITADKPLPGRAELTDEEVKRLADESGLHHDVVSHLSELYGSRCREVMDIAREDSSGSQQISAGGPDIIAQIRHAVKMESCITLSDFMVRRSIIGLRKDQGADAVAVVANEMQKLLNWTEEEKKLQIEAQNYLSSLGQRFRNI